MERLTLSNNHIHTDAGIWILKNGQPKELVSDDCDEYEYFKKLAEYEDLEEQGKLLKLPCKAGQRVYLLRKDIKKVVEGEITSINISEFAMGMRIFIIDDNRYTNASFDKIGKIVFFIPEEAEAALEEMRKG